MTEGVIYVRKLFIRKRWQIDLISMSSRADPLSAYSHVIHAYSARGLNLVLRAGLELERIYSRDLWHRARTPGVSVRLNNTFTT